MAHLLIISTNSDETIARYKEDKKQKHHTCPCCGLKRMMTVIQILEHNDECEKRKKR